MPFIQFSVLFKFAKPAEWESLKRQFFSFPVSGRESHKVLTFKTFVDEILKCDHSNESY